MIGRLPTTLKLNDMEWKIRTDYRDILNIFCAFNDSELTQDEKAIVCLTVLYENFASMGSELYTEAYKQAICFINLGREEEQDKTPHPKLMDWEQDESIIFAAVNKVAGTELRAVEYMHWWTFMGFYMGVGESVFSDVINIREKKAKNKKLEKNEQEFYIKNKSMIDLKQSESAEDRREREELERLLGV